MRSSPAERDPGASRRRRRRDRRAATTPDRRCATTASRRAASKTRDACPPARRRSTISRRPSARTRRRTGRARRRRAAARVPAREVDERRGRARPRRPWSRRRGGRPGEIATSTGWPPTSTMRERLVRRSTMAIVAALVVGDDEPAPVRRDGDRAPAADDLLLGLDHAACVGVARRGPPSSGAAAAAPAAPARKPRRVEPLTGASGLGVGAELAQHAPRAGGRAPRPSRASRRRSAAGARRRLPRRRGARGAGRRTAAARRRRARPATGEGAARLLLSGVSRPPDRVRAQRLDQRGRAVVRAPRPGASRSFSSSCRRASMSSSSGLYAGSRGEVAQLVGVLGQVVELVLLVVGDLGLRLAVHRDVAGDLEAARERGAHVALPRLADAREVLRRPDLVAGADREVLARAPSPGSSTRRDERAPAQPRVARDRVARRLPSSRQVGTMSTGLGERARCARPARC